MSACGDAARNEEIARQRLTGVGSVYEPPAAPALEIRTDVLDVPASVDALTEAVATWALGAGPRR